MAEGNSDQAQVDLNFLDFEQPIAELEAKIDALRKVGDDGGVNISEEVKRLEERSRDLSRRIYANLSPWQVAKVARHSRRPYTLDYVARLFDEVEEIHGDRLFKDDPAIVAGIARFGGRPIAFIGHQKGRNTKENLHRNFGMPRPEGYRKALRLLQLAERFRLPVLSFIDTPGAYPGIGAEERGQSEAIARNLATMAALQVPIVATVIGEGGSGGALAIGVADHVNMLQYATYAVISPEGCASILWKSTEKAADAAEAMGITASRLLSLGLIETLIEEPLGGAHRDYDAVSNEVGEALERALSSLTIFAPARLCARRYERLRNFGVYDEK